MQTLVGPSRSTTPRSQHVPCDRNDLAPPQNSRNMKLGVMNPHVVHLCNLNLGKPNPFSIKRTIKVMDQWFYLRRRSKGWTQDPPASIHPRILFGPGCYLDKPGFIEKYNISHVINCAFDTDCPESFRRKNPDKYVCLNAVDSLEADILNWYPIFESTLNMFLQDPQCRNVYVHCQCGINRSGFLSVAYACKKLKFPYHDVVKSIMFQRPCALTNPHYRSQVYHFCK